MWDGALAGMLGDELKRQSIKHQTLADLASVQGLVGAAQDREYKNAEHQRADAFGQALVKLSEAGKPLTRENILPLALENRQLAPKDFLSNDLGQERIAAQQKISRDRLNAMYQIAQDKLKASGAKADPANVARYMAALSKYNHDLDTLPEAMHGFLVMPTPEMFNLGGNPAVVGKPSGATISPTVTPAEIMRIQDPADRAAAMEALQAGRFAQPAAQVAPTSPVASPAPIPAAPSAPQPSQYAGMTNVPTAPVPTDNAVAKPEPVMPKFTGSPQEIRQKENAWRLAQSKSQLKADVNLAGGRESVYINRIVNAANQAAADLENVAKLPITVDRGLFGGRGQGKSLFEAGKETLANSMTTQEVQTYNVLATGFQRALATLESQGLAPNAGLAHQMEAIIFKDGDTNFTKLQKLAQIRQIVEKGMESTLANGRIAESQKTHIEAIIKKVEKAVPFTQADLIELQQKQQINPNITLNDIVKMKSAGSYPTATNPQTGETVIYKDGKWQKAP